jgi:hypothetical protein
MVVCPNPNPFRSFILIHYIFRLFSRNNELASSSDTKLIPRLLLMALIE